MNDCNPEREGSEPTQLPEDEAAAQAAPAGTETDGM